MSLPSRTFTVTRADLVAYAAASGDHNPIHQDEAVATAVGLPGVIAHGMYTMALAARAVADWFPDREVVSRGCKFTAPVVVPAEGGVEEGASVKVVGHVDAGGTKRGVGTQESYRRLEAQVDVYVPDEQYNQGQNLISSFSWSRPEIAK